MPRGANKKQGEKSGRNAPAAEAKTTALTKRTEGLRPEAAMGGRRTARQKKKQVKVPDQLSIYRVRGEAHQALKAPASKKVRKTRGMGRGRRRDCHGGLKRKPKGKNTENRGKCFRGVGVNCVQLTGKNPAQKGIDPWGKTARHETQGGDQKRVSFHLGERDEGGCEPPCGNDSGAENRSTRSSDGRALNR